MATVTKKQAEVTYVLELTKREANALTELLVVASHDEGEGPVLEEIYAALVDQGAESFDVDHEVVRTDHGDYVRITRDDE